VIFKEATTALWPVIGQDRAVSLLERSLERAAIAHAYLLVGPRHVGKMTLALSLAQALNCTAEERPCGQCPSCQRITQGNHADVQVIGLESGKAEETRSRTEISIDQIREMQHSASLAPFEGEYRVYIIDRAELLSLEAANALLKTLEEPAGRVVFILLTSDEDGLPVTVVSRCQRLELTALAAAEVERALRERWQIEPPKARLLGRVSHGLVGWALTAASDEKVLEERVQRLEKLISVISGGLESRFAYATEIAELFSRDRQKVREILGLWLEWWHDLMLVKLGNSESIINVDQAEKLKEMAAGYNLRQIRGFIADIQMAEEQLRQNVNPRLVLEVLILKLPERRNG
jgi:DNA polymerase-3 subunit delta'